jgi:hypothetical protein
MTDDSQNVADQIQQEADVQPQEQQAHQSHTPEEVAEEKPRYSKDENFARLRETKEQLERENRELRQWYERQAKQQPAEVEEDIGVDDDDIVEGKVVKRLYNELRELKKFKQSYEQEKVASIPERLKSKFSDFEQVVTQENVEKLKNLEPELYASIISSSDLYAKGVSAYKTLKALGIVKDDPYKAQKEQVQQNAQRPMSVQAIKGQGALSDANIFAQGLTPDLKKQLQKEMSEAAKAR